MVNFVYLSYNESYSFFGMEESEWDNRFSNLPLRCTEIIEEAFHNYPIIFKNFPCLRNAGEKVNRNWDFDEPSIDQRKINLLVYYCDTNGLDDNYFSKLVFEKCSSTRRILNDWKLSEIFKSQIDKIM